MHKSESVLENEMQEILWDFEIQINHLISARSPHIVIVNKKKKKRKKKEDLWIVDFAIPAKCAVKMKQSENVTLRPLIECYVGVTLLYKYNTKKLFWLSLFESLFWLRFSL